MWIVEVRKFQREPGGYEAARSFAHGRESLGLRVEFETTDTHHVVTVYL